MRVEQPTAVAEALRFKAEVPEAVPMAGGTDLLVHWPQALSMHERTYVDLSRIPELRAITWLERSVRLGATTTYWDVMSDARLRAALPLLDEAARTVGAVQIQTRGTWAGNIANASPAADGVPVLMAYDAVVELASAGSTRRVELADFYRGYKDMEMRPDELITAIEIPLRPRAFERFIKVGSRRAQAITKVGVALACSAEGWRVVANSVAPTVVRCRTLERELDRGWRPDKLEDVGERLRPEVQPIDDIRSTAVYRERVLARVLWYALAEAGGDGEQGAASR